MRICDLINYTTLYDQLHVYSLTMNRWLLLLGTTRSLPELGRETNTRQWYFGLSRGRVGHCRFFLNEYPFTLLLLSSLLCPLSTCSGGFLIDEKVYIDFIPILKYNASCITVKG